jgi:hypothetical protein
VYELTELRKSRAWQEIHDQGVEEGIQKGSQEGIQKGIDKGIEEGETEDQDGSSLSRQGNVNEGSRRIAGPLRSPSPAIGSKIATWLITFAGVCFMTVSSLR